MSIFDTESNLRKRTIATKKVRETTRRCAAPSPLLIAWLGRRARPVFGLAGNRGRGCRAALQCLVYGLVRRRGVRLYRSSLYLLQSELWTLSIPPVAAPYAPAYSQTSSINNLMPYQKIFNKLRMHCRKRATKHSRRVVCTLSTLAASCLHSRPHFPFGLPTPNLHIRYFPRANYRVMIGHYILHQSVHSASESFGIWLALFSFLVCDWLEVVAHVMVCLGIFNSIASLTIERSGRAVRHVRSNLPYWIIAFVYPNNNFGAIRKI